MHVTNVLEEVVNQLITLSIQLRFLGPAGSDLLVNFGDDCHGPLCRLPPRSHGRQLRVCNLQPRKEPKR